MQQMDLFSPRSVLLGRLSLYGMARTGGTAHAEETARFSSIGGNAGLGCSHKIPSAPLTKSWNGSATRGTGRE